jgi:hypothetical protein
MFCGKIYVPKDRELRHCIVEQHCDTHITGHAGRFKTLELVDNPNTTQILEYTKDKYNAKIIK